MFEWPKKMWKHRCVIGICDNDMQDPGMHKKLSNVDGDMQKLPKDGVVWVNTILKDRKQVIEESFHTLVTAYLLE